MPDDSQSSPVGRDEQPITDPTRETTIEEAARSVDGDTDGAETVSESGTGSGADSDGADAADDRPTDPEGTDDTSGAEDETDSSAESDDGETAPDESGAAEDEADGAAEEEQNEENEPVDEPTGYEFSAVGDEHWPPNVEYTPKYDDRWVYTVGGRAGGSRDDVPMQGLELQVAAPREEVAAVVRACMAGLAAYESAVGEVPRHKFVSDIAAFDAVAVDGAGTVAVFQPRADDGTDLLEHMTVFREGTTDTADLTPNRDRAQTLAAHLRAALTDAGLGADAVATYREAGGPPRPIADGRVYERYAALGAEGLYDPTGGPADVDAPGADGVDALGFEPDYLDVSDPAALRPDEPDETSDVAGAAAAPESGDACEPEVDEADDDDHGHDDGESAADGTASDLDYSGDADGEG